MKIAIITSGILPVPAVKGGAVENLVENILKVNQKINKLDIEIFGINHQDINIQKYSNIHFNLFDKKMGRNIFIKNNFFKKVLFKIDNNYEYKEYLDFVTSRIKNKYYDVVIIENRPTFVPLIKKYTSAKIVLHLHNSHLKEKSAKNLNIIKKCDAIWTVSDFLKNEIVNNFPQYRYKISKLENCIDEDLFNYRNIVDKVKVRKQLNLDSDDFIIVFLGRLVKEKGIKQLLRAFNKVNNNKIKLLIVGGSWYSCNSDYKELESLVDKNRGNVIFTGYIDYSELYKIYSISNLAILPSIWQEPSGMVILESMAMKVPIITTRSGGIVELVGENEAILLDIDDELENSILNSLMSIYENRKDINSMVENSYRKFKKKYTQEVYYDNTIELINNVIGV